MFEKNASTPPLHDYHGDLSKAWYVGFTMLNPKNHSERRFFQVRGYINSRHTDKERRSAGNALTGVVGKSLSEGWNPFEVAFSDWVKLRLTRESSPAEMGSIEALKHGLEQKKDFLSIKTHGEYGNTIKYAETAAKVIGLSI